MNEDGRTEYKVGFSDGIPKTVVAFSNCKGGTVFVGIDDDGSIVGLDDADAIARRCVQSIRDDVRPDVTSSTSVDIMNMDGKDIVRIDVSEGSDKPYFLRDKGLRAEGVYERRGPSSVPVSESRFNEMVRRIRSRTYESSQSLIQRLTFRRTEEIFDDNGIQFDEPHKAMLGMTDSEGYTNLALLLSDQCEQGIKAAVFPDDGRSAFMDRQEISGSVIGQYHDAMAFIRRHSTLSSRIVGEKRIDETDFPTEAVREAVLNAIIHRDYASTGSILISIYPDRLEIASPGSVPEDVPESDLIKGASFPRNPRLAAVFYRLGLVEAYGTGIPRMMSIYEGMGRKPELDISRAMFRVTLYRADRSPELPFPRGQIITRSELEERLGVSKSKATQIINGFISGGVLMKEGTGKGSRYRVL